MPPQKNHGQRQRMLLITMVVITLLFSACYLFLFLKVKAQNEQVSSLVNDIETESVAESTQRSTKVLVAETSKYREKLKEYLVGKDDAVSFLEFLEREGSDVGVTVKIESVVPSALTTEDVEELRLSIKASGPWAEVVRYVGLLELLPFQSRLEQLIVSISEKQGDGPWSVQAVLVVLKEK